MLKLIDKKKSQFYTQLFCLSRPMAGLNVILTYRFMLISMVNIIICRCVGCVSRLYILKCKAISPDEKIFVQKMFLTIDLRSLPITINHQGR